MVILDLVSGMCDGQKKENQDLFREQESQFNVRKRYSLTCNKMYVLFRVRDYCVIVAHAQFIDLWYIPTNFSFNFHSRVSTLSVR